MCLGMSVRSEWGCGPGVATLGPEEVHVWRAAMDVPGEALEGLRATLAEDEQARAARFRFDEDRNRYVVAHGILRALLGRILDMTPCAIRFRYNAHGKPELAGPEGPDALRFNLSHSQGLAMFAFTRGRRIGVDVQAHRKGTARPSSGERPSPNGVACSEIAERFFSPREAAAIQALPGALQERAFYDCWTRKEAFMKARGDGLTLGLDRFEVSVRPEEPAGLLRVEGAGDEASRWTIVDVAPGSGYSGALAVEGRNLVLRYWQWGG